MITDNFLPDVVADTIRSWTGCFRIGPRLVSRQRRNSMVTGHRALSERGHGVCDE
jgi:hypothetical protein